jgi:predicted metallopeptidase
VLLIRIKYVEAPDVKRRVEEIVNALNFIHIDSNFVYCFRSTGSRSKRVIARIHGLGRIWQAALHFVPIYIIEVISERYDTFSEDEKDKILIHELLHIPKGFSGGFRVHKGYVDQNTVDNLYKKLKTVSS